MKHTKKLFALVLCIVLALGLAVPAFAAETGTITITPPNGVDSNATNTYKIYKVFDAVGNGTTISYKLVDGKTTVPAGFAVDAAGNVTFSGSSLSEDNINAIAEYVKGDTPVDTVTTTGTNPGTSNALPNGYYYITTTTGSVVIIDSTNPKAEVSDKNVVPTLDKKITDASSYDENGKKALAQVGTSVEYEVTIEVKKGARDYEFHDNMGTGLKCNNDIKVYVDGTEVATGYGSKSATDNAITIDFNNDWISSQVGKIITIEYSATITSDALHTVPAKNTAWLEYGNSANGSSSNKTPDSETEVYNAKFTVTKQDGDKQPLAGAGFVIKNADGKYYKLTDGVVSWVDSMDDATEYKSDTNGAVPAFTGLANGTYTLVEKTVPAGYNMAADSTFTIAEHDYTPANLVKSATVINKAGTELPETGGIGTTIFYAVGGLMVVGAVVLLVTKKRMSAEG